MTVKKRPSPMKPARKSEQIGYSRRRFLCSAAMTVAASQFVTRGFAEEQSSGSTVSPITNSGFAPIKQIEAGVLNVGYAEAGPGDGPVAVLLHGWPYDIYSYADVTPLLTAAGYRVIVPYLRGYGSTGFLSSTTFRNGQQSVVAVDIVAYGRPQNRESGHCRF